jgi:hypothetical protein
VTDDFDQLAAELRWLRTQALLFTSHKNHRPQSRTVQSERVEARIEEHLNDLRLREVLDLLERKNRDRLRERGRRRAPFLLGPYLRHIVRAVESRREFIAKMPALRGTPAELREHYREVAGKASVLAAVLRKAPQPNVVLAARDEEWEAFSLLWWPLLETTNKGPTPLAEVLDDAATTLRVMAKMVSSEMPRRQYGKKQAEQHASEVRRFAAWRFADLFRSELDRPLHEHVATLATVLSGINTDADYVKKEEKRRRARRGQNSPEN